MDQLQTRLDALEQQVQTLTQHTHTVTRRLHWWRGLACGAIVLAGLTWALPAVIAQEDGREKGQKGLAQRVAALEQLLKQFSREGKEIFITGANLHIVNGLGRTDCGTEEEPISDCPNGLGNLIVGYNELRKELPGCESDPTNPFCTDTRTGSHNVVVGQFHNFSRVGGLVVGDFHTIGGNFASVSGGRFNTVSGDYASVSGGPQNTANGEVSSASGGSGNTASGMFSSVSGGGEIDDAGLPAGITVSESNGWAAGTFGEEISGSFRSP
jgi:hypothetical protein